MFQVHRLVPSTNRGRYALDTPDGADITSGLALEINIGAQWIAGRVESARASQTRAIRGTYATSDIPAPQVPIVSGYYFIADTGEVCGLCVGMKVKVSR